MTNRNKLSLAALDELNVVSDGLLEYITKANPDVDADAFKSGLFELVAVALRDDGGSSFEVLSSLEADVDPAYNSTADAIALAHSMWVNGDVKAAVKFCMEAFSLPDCENLITALVSINDEVENRDMDSSASDIDSLDAQEANRLHDTGTLEVSNPSEPANSTVRGPNDLDTDSMDVHHIETTSSDEADKIIEDALAALNGGTMGFDSPPAGSYDDDIIDDGEYEGSMGGDQDFEDPDHLGAGGYSDDWEDPEDEESPDEDDESSDEDDEDDDINFAGASIVDEFKRDRDAIAAANRISMSGSKRDVRRAEDMLRTLRSRRAA